MSPYPGVDLGDVYSLLESGYRLESPKLCPLSIYNIMKDCWQWRPNDRPDFVQLHSMVEWTKAHGQSKQMISQKCLFFQIERLYLDRDAQKVAEQEDNVVIQKKIPPKPPERRSSYPSKVVEEDRRSVSPRSDASSSGNTFNSNASSSYFSAQDDSAHTSPDGKTTTSLADRLVNELNKKISNREDRVKPSDVAISFNTYSSEDSHPDRPQSIAALKQIWESKAKSSPVHLIKPVVPVKPMVKNPNLTTCVRPPTSSQAAETKSHIYASPGPKAHRDALMHLAGNLQTILSQMLKNTQHLTCELVDVSDSVIAFCQPCLSYQDQVPPTSRFQFRALVSLLENKSKDLRTSKVRQSGQIMESIHSILQELVLLIQK